MKSMLNSKQRGIICWFIIISIILFLLSGCSNTKQYEVKFNSNGGTEVESIMITKNTINKKNLILILK